MASPKADGSERYTYADYLTWDGPERWELIDGVPFVMASPSREHQRIALRLGAEFEMFLRGKPCEAFIAPMDLTMEEDMITKQVVQPDLFVMRRPYKGDTRIVGVPFLVVEILSPSTAANDFVRKLNLYQRFGVKEYWIIEPDTQTVNVYLHDGSSLRWTAEYKPGSTLAPSIFEELAIDVNTLFGRYDQ